MLLLGAAVSPSACMSLYAKHALVIEDVRVAVEK